MATVSQKLLLLVSPFRFQWVIRRIEGSNGIEIIQGPHGRIHHHAKKTLLEKMITYEKTMISLEILDLVLDTLIEHLEMGDKSTVQIGKEMIPLMDDVGKKEEVRHRMQEIFHCQQGDETIQPMELLDVVFLLMKFVVVLEIPEMSVPCQVLTIEDAR